MDSKARNVEPFYWLLGSAAFVVIIAGMRAAHSLVVPFLIAAFLAVICTPALQWLRAKGIREWLAILLVVFSVSLVVLAVVIVATGSINEFIRRVPSYQETLRARQGELDTWINEKVSSLREQLLQGGSVEGDDDEESNSDGNRPEPSQPAGSRLQELFSSTDMMGYVTTVLNGLTSAFSNVFLVLLTVLFMLFEATGFPQKLLAISNGNPRTLEKAEQVREAIVHYISLKTALSLATGVLVSLLVVVLGIDFPILWGMIAFLLNFIPNVGSILAAIPAVLLALVQHDLSTALMAAAGYVAINIGIGNVIEPRVMGNGLGLSTLVVLVSLVFWGWVLGVVGMLLSVPLTMIVKIVMEGFEETRWLAVLLGSNPESKGAAA